MNQRKRSRELFSEAQRYLPGGVNSPVRAFKFVEGEPPFMARAGGSRIWDVDGNEYIDYVLSWGPLILGHAHPRVVQAIRDAAEQGTSFGTPTEREVRLAKMICQALPSIEMVRLVNSGTEATMSAIRLARAHTGREKVLKFEGCYHGHADSLLVRAGSGAATLGIPDSPGVPRDLAQHTLTVPYNDLEAVRGIFSREANQLACIIVEPIAANMGVIPPREGFLEGLRQLTRDHDAVLIFDEVITGFRVAYGGAQERYQVQPDLTCLGKVIGGGLPVGAYGGRREMMEKIAPSGPVYQAGTLSGNPIAVAAGIATLEILSQQEAYNQLDKKSETLFEELRKVAGKTAVPVTGERVGSLFSLFFTDQKVTHYTNALDCDQSAFIRFFKTMLQEGIYLAPSPFESTFLSTAHTDQDIEQTLKAAHAAFQSI